MTLRERERYCQIVFFFSVSLFRLFRLVFCSVLFSDFMSGSGQQFARDSLSDICSVMKSIRKIVIGDPIESRLNISLFGRLIYILVYALSGSIVAHVSLYLPILF